MVDEGLSNVLDETMTRKSDYAKHRLDLYILERATRLSACDSHQQKGSSRSGCGRSIRNER